MKARCNLGAFIVLMMLAAPVAGHRHTTLDEAAKPYSFKPIASLTNYGLYPSFSFLNADAVPVRNKASIGPRAGGRLELLTS